MGEFQETVKTGVFSYNASSTTSQTNEASTSSKSIKNVTLQSKSKPLNLRDIPAGMTRAGLNIQRGSR